MELPNEQNTESGRASAPDPAVSGARRASEFFVESIAKRFADATRSGDGWKAKCPAHDDRQASLSIGVGSGGRALVKCHAGCKTEASCSAVGLRMADLFPPKTERRIVDAYDYCDEHGELLSQAVRYEPKDFRQRKPKPGGGWDWSVRGLRIVPYRLPELIAADPTQWVVVCEGEKDCDNLAKLGIVATTNAGGAGKWRAEHAAFLRDRKVAIIPDKDDAGAKHAIQVERSLFGIAAEIKIVDLPGLPPKGDASDWIAAGGTADQLSALIAAAPAFDETASDPAPTATEADEQQVTAPAFRPFPLPCLPEPIRTFVSETATSTGCDPSFAAIPALCVCAAALGNTLRIALKDDWHEPPVLYAGTVGESGDTKGPALRPCVQPLKTRELAAAKRYADAMKEYRKACAIYEKQFKKWQRQQTTELPPIEPEPPARVRYFASDLTFEALVPILSENWRGIFLEREELGGFFGSFDRYANKGRVSSDAAQWLSIFNCEMIVVDRKSGEPKTICVPMPAVWIIGSIQPATLNRVLTQEHRDSGLAARFLWANPPKRLNQWTDAVINPATTAAYDRVIDALYSFKPNVDENGQPQPVVLPLSEAARLLWIDFYNIQNRERFWLRGDMAAVWRKLEAYTARLALVHHCIRRAADDPTLEDRNSIDAASMQAGIELARWFGNEAKRLYSAMGSMPTEGDDTAELIELIQSKGGKITPSELAHAKAKYRAAGSAIERLRKLVRDGYGRMDDTATGGRPTEAFLLTYPDIYKQNNTTSTTSVHASSIAA